MSSTTNRPDNGGGDDDDDDDTIFIIAMVLFAIGALLILIGIIKLIIWYCKLRDNADEEKKKIKALEHIRHLEEYSIRTSEHNTPRGTPKSAISGGSDSVFRYDNMAGVNPAYVVDNHDGVPRTYLRVTHSSASSTGRRSPFGGSIGGDPEMSRMAGTSEVTIAHPCDDHGVARVMVGGGGDGVTHPTPPPPGPLQMIQVTDAKTSTVETSSQYSSMGRQHYGDVMF